MGEVSSEFTEINRSRAKAVKERLKRMGLTITLGQAYEIVAVAHDHRNWPVMKASSPSLSPTPAPETARVLLSAEERVDQVISQFKDFIEMRQKHFVPRNKLLVIGGTVEDRRKFADDAARALDLDIVVIGESGAEGTEIEEAFMASFRKRKLLFIDRVERLEVRQGGSEETLCRCLEEMPRGQMVVMGTERGVDVLPLSILRRAQFRHNLN